MNTSRSDGAAYACRQRIAKTSLGRIDVFGGVSGQQGADPRDWDAVPVQDATRGGTGSVFFFSYRFHGLRAH